MARSRSRVGSSPFLKRVMIPFWVVRLSIMVTEIVANAIVLNFLRVRYYRHNIPDSEPVFYILIALLTVLSLCALLDIVCIIKRARNTLTPVFFFAVNLIQTTIFVILFGVSVAGAFALRNVLLYTLGFLSFVGFLIYASVIFHRHRNGSLQDKYEPASDTEAQKLVAPTAYSSVPLEIYETPELSRPGTMAVPLDFTSRSMGYEPHRPADARVPLQTTTYG